MTHAAARGVALFALLGTAIALGACTTLGTGSGSLSPGGAPVTFAWQSTHAGMSGTMQATLASGQIFSGRYTETARELSGEDSDIVLESLSRASIDWGSDLPLWDGWTPYPDDLVTQYSPWLVVNLQAANGQRMSCRFQLNTPSEGMKAGGQGSCRLDNGGTIAAVFPQAER